MSKLFLKPKGKNLKEVEYSKQSGHKGTNVYFYLISKLTIKFPELCCVAQVINASTAQGSKYKVHKLYHTCMVNWFLTDMLL